MKHLHSLILISALILFCSCGNKKSFTITGTLDNGAGKTVYIEEIVPGAEEPLFIDSIILDNKGAFTFKYSMPYPTFYNLHVSDVDYIVLLPKNGETINIKGNYNDFSTSYSLEGSPESQLLWQLQDYTNIGITAIREIVEIDQQNRERFGQDSNGYKKAKLETDTMFLDARNAQAEYICKFIVDNRGSLATLIALYKPFNNQPLLRPDLNFDYYEYVLDGLQEALPENPHTLHFKSSVEFLRHKYGGTPEAVGMSFDEIANEE